MKTSINESDLHAALEKHEEKIPIVLQHVRKNEQIEMFKEGKVFLKSREHQTSQFLFRRILFKPFI